MSTVCNDWMDVEKQDFYAIAKEQIKIKSHINEPEMAGSVFDGIRNAVYEDWGAEPREGDGIARAWITDPKVYPGMPMSQ